MSKSVQAERMRVRWSWVEFGEVGKGVQPKVRTEGCWWPEEPFSTGDTPPDQSTNSCGTGQDSPFRFSAVMSE